MGRIRVTVAGLMVAVVVAAGGFAALKEPSPLAAGGMFLLAVAVLLAATLGALLRDRPHRAPWLGFALFGWGYFLLAFGPCLAAERTTYDVQRGEFIAVANPTLATSKLLEYLYRLEFPEALYNTNAVVQVLEWGQEGKKSYNSYVVWRLCEGYHQRAGHALACLLSAALGAIVGTLLVPRGRPQP